MTHINDKLAFAMKEEHTTEEEARELRAYMVTEEAFNLPTSEYLHLATQLGHMEQKLRVLRGNIEQLIETKEAIEFLKEHGGADMENTTPRWNPQYDDRFGLLEA